MLDFKGYGWTLFEGLQLTLSVGAAAMLVAVALGLAGALAKLSRNRIARHLAESYTVTMRGVPELILLLLVYYGVPTLMQDIAASLGYAIRVDLNPFTAGALTVGFIYGAFSTEVFRGAFQAIERGQLEAARAMGMSRGLVLRRILFPQALRYALPGLGNVWMVLIKATALISVIQLEEIMRKAQIAAGATRQPFTFYLGAAALYLGITIVSMYVQGRLERWAERGQERC